MNGYEIKVGNTVRPLLFLMVDSADHLAAKTGLSPTVTLAKNDGAFAAPAGAVSEVGNGWYAVAGNATDADTLGVITLHAEAAGADVTDRQFPVVAYNTSVAYSTHAPADVAALVLATPANKLATDGSGRVTVDDRTGYALSPAGVSAVQSGLSTYAGADTPGTTTLLSRVTDSVLLATDYTAPDNAGIAAAQAAAEAAQARVETALPNAAPSTDTGLPTTADLGGITATVDLSPVTDLIGTPAGASLSADVAAVAAVVGAGGARAISVQVRTPDGDPVPLCRVWIAGVVSLNTDTAGDATLHLDDGAYVLHLYAPSYEAFEPVALVVSGDATVTYALTPITVTPATDPSLCHVQGYARTLDGELRAAHQLTFELVAPMGTRALMDGAALLERRTPQRPVSDANGLFDFYLERTDTLSVPGCVWRVSSSLAGFNGVEFELAQASATLAELLG